MYPPPRLTPTDKPHTNPHDTAWRSRRRQEAIACPRTCRYVLGSAYKKAGSVTPYDKTTSVNLVTAREKDSRKEATTKKKKNDALAQIGNELGVTVMVNGIDVVEAYNTRGTRKHFCPFCKMTLTRVCSKKKCKDLREGKQVIAEREDDEPELSSDEDEPEQSDDESVLPLVNSLLQVDVESGKGRNKTTETFFCTVKEYEADGAVILTTQDGETMNIFLDDYFWKRVYHCVQCLHYGVTKLKCDACGLERTSTPAI